MVEYICDGSTRGLDQGAGVVRISDNGEISYYNFHRKINNNEIGKQEEFAVLKALELIVENEDFNVSIYNDGQDVIRRLKGGNVKKSQVELREIKNFADDLSSKGYNIKFSKIGKFKHSKYYKKAHDLSRNYIK